MSNADAPDETSVRVPRAFSRFLESVAAVLSFRSGDQRLISRDPADGGQLSEAQWLADGWRRSSVRVGPKTEIPVTAWSDWLADVDAVTVQVLKHEGPETIVFVLDGLDDAQAVTLTDGVRGVGIVDHHVGNIERCCLVIGLKREMQLGVVPLHNHETDRVAILERFREAENLPIEVVGPYDILHREHGGNSPEANAVIGGVVHRITPYKEDAADDPDGAVTLLSPW